MSPHFDALEIRDLAEREHDLFSRLPRFLSDAVGKAEGLADWLSGHDLSKIVDRQALASLPVLRKPELLERQKQNPPFGGFVDPDALEGARVFMSPGPIPGRRPAPSLPPVCGRVRACTTPLPIT